QTGNVDFCIASSTIVDHVKNSRTVRFLGLPPAGFQILPLNTKQGVLADARVRRALSAALNRTELTNVVSPVARVVRGPMPLNSPFLNARIGQPDNDPALADRLLNSAGWTRRDGPIRVNAAGQPLRVSVVAPQQAAPVMTAIQAQWRRAGVDLDLRMMEFAAFMGVVQNPATRPEATILGWFIDRVLTPDLFNQLHSKSPMNLSAFANPRADSALEQLRIVTREADRRALYDLVQTIVAEEVPNIYVMHTPRIGVLGPRLQGVQFDQNGAFATLTQWRVTGRPR
ncbi:MAG TPA: ABC transporter substrate-binding protein, partial [Longimicrobiales bacterium]|nr:ABC transporter substrate-binding protein [Longimicrobiales bacterium]